MSLTTTNTRIDFSTRVVAVAAQLLAAIEAADAITCDYNDLFAAEINPADYKGTALEGITTQYIGQMTVISGLLDTALATEGTRVVLKALAQFSK